MKDTARIRKSEKFEKKDFGEYITELARQDKKMDEEGFCSAQRDNGTAKTNPNPRNSHKDERRWKKRSPQGADEQGGPRNQERTRRSLQLIRKEQEKQ